MPDRQPRSYHLTRPDGVGFFRHWSARQASVGFIGLFLALSAVRVHGPVTLRITMIVVGMTVVALGLGRAPGGEPLVDLAGPFGRFALRSLARRRRWTAAISPLGGSPGAVVPPLFAGIVLHDIDPGAMLGRPGRPL